MSQAQSKFIPNGSLTLTKLAQSAATLNQSIIWNGTAWVPFTRDTLLLNNAIQTVAVVTPTTITQLTTASLAVGTYKWSVRAICQSTNVGNGLGLRMVNVGATLGICNGKWNISQAVDGVSKNFQYDQLTVATNISSASALTANSDFLVTGDGILTVTVAGTIAVQLRSEGAVAVSIRPNSYLHLERLL